MCYIKVWFGYRDKEVLQFEAEKKLPCHRSLCGYQHPGHLNMKTPAFQSRQTEAEVSELFRGTTEQGLNDQEFFYGDI
jgi:hypothetical protein